MYVCVPRKYKYFYNGIKEIGEDTVDVSSAIVPFNKAVKKVILVTIFLTI